MQYRKPAIRNQCKLQPNSKPDKGYQGIGGDNLMGQFGGIDSEIELRLLPDPQKRD